MLRSLFLAIVLLVVAGCQSFTMLQTPIPVEPGHITAGLGAAIPVLENSTGLVPEANVRLGLTSWADAGVKVSMGGMVMVEGKVQWLSSPVHVSTDIGWSTHHWSGGSGNGTSVTTTGWYPALLIGDDHWYAGIRGTYISSSGTIEFFEKQSVEGRQWVCSNLILGASIGTTFRIIPEVNLYHFKNSNGITFIPAVGFQLNL